MRHDGGLHATALVRGASRLAAEGTLKVIERYGWTGPSRANTVHTALAVDDVAATEANGGSRADLLRVTYWAIIIGGWKRNG